MADEKTAVLAARVLSYLKRTSGKGSKPTDSETKAALAAFTLLSNSFPLEAKDPVKMFEKLIQLARGNPGLTRTELMDLEMLKLQSMMNKRAQMFDMLKSVMERYDATAKNVIQNIRG
jgi:hypothetical protein